MRMVVLVDQIRLDGNTQCREIQYDDEIVDRYKTLMEEGAEFPPPIVYYDGDNHWLADGFSRVKATKLRGSSGISVECREGTLEDAKVCAAAANGLHGRNRTNGDIAKSLDVFLQTSIGRTMANNGEEGVAAIANHVRCSVRSVYVAKKRCRLQETEQPKQLHDVGANDDVVDVDSRTPTQRATVVVAAVTANPSASLEDVSKTCGVSTASVSRYKRAAGIRSKTGRKKNAPEVKPVAIEVDKQPAATVQVPVPLKPVQQPTLTLSLSERDTIAPFVTAMRAMRPTAERLDAIWSTMRMEILK